MATGDDIPKRLSEIYIRIDELKTRASKDPGLIEEILSSAFEELEVSLEELSSADEELMQQNEELTEAAEENRRLLTAVQEERDKLSALVNSISDEVWFADTKKRFTLANPSALREFGLGSNGEVGVEKLAESLEVYRPDGSPRPVEEAPPLRALLGESIRGMEEMIRTPATGELRYRQVSAAPVRDAGGNIIGSVSVVRDITGNKTMEKELAHLASFPRLDPNPIVEVDQEGRVHYLNDAARKLFPDLLERGPDHPWLTDWAQMAWMFQKNKPQTCVRNLSIGEIWYQQSIYFIPELQKVRIYSLDITERKQSEEALRESEARYRSLFDSMTEGFALHEIICDEHGEPVDYRFLDVNPAFERITGLKLEDVIGKTHNEVLPNDDPRWVKEYGAVSITGVPTWFENYSPALKRHYGIFAYCPAPRQFAVIFVDITERKHREAQIAKLTQLYVILSRVNEAIVRIREEKSLLSEVCRIVAKEGGFPLVWIGQVKGQQVVPVAWSGPAADYLKEIKVEVQGDLGRGPTGSCIREDRPAINDDFATNPATSPWREPAKRYGFRASAAFPLHRQGKAVGAFTLYSSDPDAFDETQVGLLESLSSDISFALDALDQERLRAQAEQALARSRDDLERRVQQRTAELQGAKEEMEIANEELQVELEQHQKLEADLVKAKDAAEEAAEAKAAFLANMSHEIRTPMNAVIGFTSLLLEEPLTHDQKDYIEGIRNGGEALLGLINEILDFSRADKEKVVLEHQPFSLRHCIESSLDMVASQANQKGLNLSYTISYGTPDAIIGDPGRLRQVLVNLLGNAVKFTDEGEVSIIVSAQANEGDKQKFYFLVRDTGIGIQPDKLDKIFEPFTQVERVISRKRDGAGLGLAISKKLVELMGGRIWAKSVPGQGSAFHFTIRAGVIPGRHMDLGEANKENAFEDLAVQNPLSILVAEDNPSNQRVLVTMLKRMGYRPDAVSDGKEVLQALELRPYDLILMDVKMPEMDGITATQVIRKLQPEEGPKIVAITAYALEGDREMCLEAGMDGYIAKPVQTGELVEVLKRCSQKVQ